MTRFPRLGALAVATLAATAVLAQANVQNPAVKARMEAMKTIGANTKVLADMARGLADFDAAAAQAAAGTIADTAATVPDLFSANETDPESKALPAIWTNFDDFTAKAGDLQTAAAAGATSITSPETLGPALGQIGGTCQACHKVYQK